MTTTLPTLTLRDLIRLAGEHAERVLLEMKHDSLLPSYCLFNAEGEGLIVGFPWTDDSEKAAILRRVKSAAADHRATAFSFVSEVWMTDTRTEHDALMIRPSEHPRRREYVFAVARDGKATETGRWQIVRDRPGGAIIALVADPTTDPGIFTGRLVEGILP